MKTNNIIDEIKSKLTGNKEQDVPYLHEQLRKYQRDNNLNNSQTAKHFKMSRNTLYKWKKNFK
mgnify:CR=1 FL=1